MIETKNDYYREKLNGLDCILAYESAAEYLGVTNGSFGKEVKVISDHVIERDNIKTTIVRDLWKRDYELIKGIYCTSLSQTFNDLLCNQDSDYQILLESLANYYYSHGESFDGLNLLPEAQQRLKALERDAIEYYNEY